MIHELGMDPFDRPLGLIEISLGPDWSIQFPFSQAKQCVRRRDGHKDAGVQHHRKALHRYFSADRATSERAFFSAAATSSGDSLES